MQGTRTHSSAVLFMLIVAVALLAACGLATATSTLPPIPTATATAALPPTQPPAPPSATPTRPPTATVAPTRPPATATPAAPSLTSGVWMLNRIEYSSGKVTEVEQPERYTVEFLGDGKVRIKADCNSGSGSYTAGESRLGIGTLITTKVACPAGSLFDRYLEYLGMAAAYTFDDGSLVISLSYEAGALYFGRAAVR